MSVKQRRDSGAWEVTVCLPGKPTIRRSDRAWSKRDAQRVEYELLNEEKKTTYTLDQAITKWREEHIVHLKSAKGSGEHADRLQEYTNGYALSDVCEVARIIKAKMAKLKPATINRRLAILRQVANLAFETWHPQWLHEPLGHKIKLLPEHNERHYYLTRAQVEGLAQACEIKAAGELIVFAAFTGLRKSEMWNAAKSHVLHGNLMLDSRTKNGRPRAVPLHPRALHIAERLPLEITPKQLRCEWDKVRRTLHLQHIHWHDLRHTFASWLVQAGVSLLEVKALMGHSTVKVTERYAHLAPGSLSAAIAKLN